jgi:hypothetical protein
LKSASSKRPFDSWDLLKVLAITLMFVDHSGHFFFTHQPWLHAVGRSGMPIFLFLAGYAASYRFRWDILILAVLMAISDILLSGHLRAQNTLFMILGSRMLFNWLERRGKFIESPWEWYTGSLALFMSVFAVQYGSFGFLFALAGYFKRHSERYKPGLPQRFLIVTFITDTLYMQLCGLFSIPNIVLMVMSMYAVYRIINWLTAHQIQPHRAPPLVLRIGKWISYYSGYIYAFHLIILEWVTKIPF